MPMHHKKKKTLTKSQKDTLAKLKANHTAKHIAVMRKEMKEGKSLRQAHNIAQRKVGK